ncbi:hypothetical protein DM790_03110, partial [Flavobacterium collinsii]|nr:hypothetical protein [Flavobacterium collinsii]
QNVFCFRNFLLKTGVPAPIAVEILLFFPLKSKRLKRIAGNSSSKFKFQLQCLKSHLSFISMMRTRRTAVRLYGKSELH